VLNAECKLPTAKYQVAKLSAKARGSKLTARGSSARRASHRKLTLRSSPIHIKSNSMQEKPLEIERIEDNPGTTVLRIHGPLLLGNFFPLQTMVRSDNSPMLILDVTDMPYIDSAGIGCLVGAHVSRENSGRKLVLVGANERLQTSLKVTKCDQLFTMAPTVEEAMNKAGGA
jgi:anti-sigma B factor antagonist